VRFRLRDILDDQLDAITQRTLPTLGARLIIGVLAASILSLVVSRQAGLAWIAAFVVSEVISWRASRPQRHGVPSTTGQRIFYLVSLVFMNLVWSALALTLWNQGSPSIRLAAVFVLASGLFHAQTFTARSNIAFAIVGGIPATTLLGLIFLGSNEASMPGRAMAGFGALLFLTYFAVGAKANRTHAAHLEAVKREAVAASAAKSAFLAMMSHEVRTPMNAVLGAAALLKASTLTPAQQEQVDMLTDGGHVLMRVLNDILDFSKLEAKKLQIAPVDTDLGALLQRSGHLWSPVAAAKGLVFVVEAAPDTPQWIVADGARLSQIVNNLISNAIKFTPTGSVTLSARVEPGPQLILEVADTGIGMNAEVLGRLFSAFEQADNSIAREFGGTGLGLAISRNLAELMNGDVEVASTLGAGTQFTVRVPVILAEAPESLAPAAPLDTASLLELRVLLAEDHPVNQRLVTLFLEPLGVDLTIVGDGQAALDALAVAPFDLVLMDMQMPVLDGLEATRRLRASDGINAAIPVLSLTANAMEAERDTCIQAGMNGHVAKPIDPNELIEALLTSGRWSAEAMAPAQPALSA
jgi:signal transduction histidine kinase/CheY-like chemotaxis protein